MSVSSRLYKQSRRLPKYRPLSWPEFLRQTVAKDPVLWIAATLALVSSLALRPPASAYAGFIDFKTLSCLTSLMTASGGLMLCGVFDLAAARTAARCPGARALAAAMTLVTFVASMFITNDVALIIFVPMTIKAFEQVDGDPMATVVLQTVAANVGSMLLPMGNPQNLYLYSRYGMEFIPFLRAVWPLSLAGLALLALSCGFVKNEPLPRTAPPSLVPPTRDAALYSVLFGLAILGVFDLLHHGVALAAAILIIARKGRALAQQVDYALLATFVGFFVFVGNIAGVAAVDSLMRRLVAPQPFLASVLSSQIVSNVPAAVMLSRFSDDGYALLAGVNAGGCGTLIASMASLISYKLYVRAGGGKKRFLLFFTLVNILALAAMAAAYRLAG